MIDELIEKVKENFSDSNLCLIVNKNDSKFLTQGMTDFVKNWINWYQNFEDTFEEHTIYGKDKSMLYLRPHNTDQLLVLHSQEVNHTQLLNFIKNWNFED